MTPDRREQAKADRWARILAAATELFAEQGYDAVTTRDVAKAAGVGMGTLFRHAGSKPALLVHVMNDLLDEGVRRAGALVDGGASIGRASAAIVEPLIAEGASHPQNLRAYQRETLFGAPDLRLLAVEHLTVLESTLVDLLAAHARRRPGVEASEVAHLVSAVVTMELIRAGAGRTPFDEVAPRIERSVELVLTGLLEPRP
ncbi:MAG: TetR/AcrR family transcriptional regulator [Actinobacteria bacterium]|nr:TetR/AcrR family transcriptional regulator [Actinomycetota bacterium]MCG2799663.1 TetR/AcrR family transcriptional regulator [Cellulomonas sp.]